ncbi:MAG: ABC-F family ATP-binding cassette domain-containing protein [Rhodospirillales bacterium]|nr:ABC-F family ATP-binding cassette domain-containing protein [Rhodospirillales bacterium]
MLRLDKITLRVAGRPLLEDASASVSCGQRVGLVGPNGAGKTTLLRLIEGQLQADAGSLEITGGWRVGHLTQEPPGGSRALIDIVLSADEERSRLLAEAEDCADPACLADMHERLRTIGADSAPGRAARILAGLGFSGAQQARPASEFSGGWRMRVALASLLFRQPELLLLDEPSNHLDLEATLWLEGFLARYPGSLLLVSHDRRLLDSAVNRIIHLDGGKLVAYEGNYETFQRTRRERQAQQAAVAAKQEAQRKHIQSFVDRFRYKASKARQAQARLKTLAKLEPIVPLGNRRESRFTFPAPQTVAPPLLAVDRVFVGYAADRPVLKNVSFRLDPDDRVGLLGANGSGKTTLIRLLAGQLRPLAGGMTRPPRLKVGYYAQDQADQLDPETTPLTLMLRDDPRGVPQRHRAHLAQFGLDAERVDTPVRHLSGGEKARLVFALVTRQAPQLLLLDEPTNHLDMEARDGLIEALNDFPGAAVVVSHDPHLLNLVTDRLWLIAGGRLRAFEGDLEDYRRQVLNERQLEKEARAKAADKLKAPRVKPAPAKRAEQGHLKRVVSQAEQRLETLNKAKDILEQRLADPASYCRPAAELKALRSKHAEIVAAIERTEEIWLSAQSALEEG